VWGKPAKEGFLLRFLRNFTSKYNSEIPYRKFMGRVFSLHGSIQPNYLSTPCCSCTDLWYSLILTENAPRI
jgi:hypothetical protein